MRSWSCASGWGGFGHMSGWMGFGMGFWTIAALLVVLIVAYLMFRSFGHGGREQSSALDILNEQYALGKINEDEYLKRKKNLKRS